MIKFLCWLKAKTLVSQALIDMDITNEELFMILNDKDKYEKMKNNLRSENGESYEIMRLSSIKSKIQKIKNKKYFFV